MTKSSGPKLPSVSSEYDNAHEVIPGSQDTISGTRLDAVRAREEEEYRKRRTEEINAAAEQAAKESEAEEDETEQEKETDSEVTETVVFTPDKSLEEKIQEKVSGNDGSNN